MVAAAVVAALLIVLAGAQAIVSQGAFQLSELTDRAQRLEAEADRLRLRVARLSTPDRIVAAGRRAGLGMPTQVETLGKEYP
jgi:cell division protein FtsL